MIHPTALISSDAQFGSDVSVGAYTIIHGNVQIGDGCNIGSHLKLATPPPRARPSSGYRTWGKYSLA